MSQFDKYNSASYVDGLRSFLKMKRVGFSHKQGLLPEINSGKKGRSSGYSDEAVKNLEAEVNLKAERAEAGSTTLGERIKIARDYKFWSNENISRAMNVSRELVRLWCINTHKPNNLEALANLLDVPLIWLEYGGEMHLPANSHIGVRVGNESYLNRETLYANTLGLLHEIPENSDAEYAQAYIEQKVKADEIFSRLARRAGGRWQLHEGILVFASWIPIEDYKMTRKLWTDEVEAIISEEISANTTIYRAWKSIESRFKAMGLSEKNYPKKISLYKRVEAERQRIRKHGINLNEVINYSLKKNSKPH